MTDLKTGDWCYYIPLAAFVRGTGYIPSVVQRGVKGHSPLSGNGKLSEPWYWGMTYDEAQALCVEQNRKIGITAKMADDIVTSSMAAKHPPQTINLEPHWPGVFRFLSHIEETDPDQFKKLVEIIGEEDWEKIKMLGRQ